MIVFFLALMLLAAFVLLYHVTLELNRLDSTIRALGDRIRKYYERTAGAESD